MERQVEPKIWGTLNLNFRHRKNKESRSRDRNHKKYNTGQKYFYRAHRKFQRFTRNRKVGINGMLGRKEDNEK